MHRTEGYVDIDDRSQPILRVPIAPMPAIVMLHDGTRINVRLFVTPGEDFTSVIEGDSAFVPLGLATGTRLVARDTIACITVHVVQVEHAYRDVQPERQRVSVRLRSGDKLKGELRWVAPADRRRTLDHLNDASNYIVLWDDEYVNYIVKQHVAYVEEA